MLISLGEELREENSIKNKMLIFTKPQFLILLLAIPIVIFFHLISIKMAKRRAIKFANFDAISKVQGGDIFSKNLSILYLRMLIIALVVLAISGTSILSEVNTSQYSFVLAIDASRSMIVNDIQPSRIEAAKTAAIDFLRMIPAKTKVGVVSFSGTSYIEQELSDDKMVVSTAIENIELKQVGGTDIYNAIITSAGLLGDEEQKNVILISDGSTNINSLQDAINYAKNNNLKINSLGIGTKEGGEDEFGGLFKVDETTLRTIAESTGGKYYSISNLEDFYSSFNDIVLITRKNVVFDLSFYLMLAALVVLIVEFILINTRYRTFP